jgi:uncharacterized UBP type Zn finger protein
MPTCHHLDRLYDAAPPSEAAGCEECLLTGGTWVHLRRCQTCGHVGCCDQSVGRHASRHFHESKHPVARSAQGREQWAWCYVDKIEYDPDEDWDREGASLG